MLKLLNVTCQLLRARLDQRRNDDALLLVPKLVLAEHVVAILSRQTNCLNHTHLQDLGLKKETKGVWFLT